MVFTHGSQDWNVKPLHVFNMFQALPASIRNTSSTTMVPMSISTTGSPLTSVSMNALLSKNCWATIQAMNCLLSSGRTIQENKVGLPWMILATKQVSGPSRWETTKSHPKPLRDKDYERWQRLIRPS